MIVTEDDARTKWCAQVRAAEPDDMKALNSTGVERNPHWSRCIGSQCMAWRWHEQGRQTTTGRMFRGVRPPDNDPRWRADMAGSVDDESVAGIEAFEQALGPDLWNGRTYDWHIAAERLPDTGFCGLAYSVRLP